MNRLFIRAQSSTLSDVGQEDYVVVRALEEQFDDVPIVINNMDKKER